LPFVDEGRHLPLAHDELRAVLDLVLVALEAVGERVARIVEPLDDVDQFAHQLVPEGHVFSLENECRGKDTVPLDAFSTQRWIRPMALTLSALNIYPVKGLKGIAVDAADCTDRGLRHDRRWMVVDSEGVFLSQREHPRMATVWTDITDDALVLSTPETDSVEIRSSPAAARRALRVRVWNSVGRCDSRIARGRRVARDVPWPSVPPRLHARRHAARIQREIRREGNLVGFADGFAYLLANEASLADLNARLAAKRHRALPMNRFRPNLVVSGAPAFAEDGWKEIRVGEAILRAEKPCGRCQVTTTGPGDGRSRRAGAARHALDVPREQRVRRDVRDEPRHREARRGARGRCDRIGVSAVPLSTHRMHRHRDPSRDEREAAEGSGNAERLSRQGQHPQRAAEEHDAERVQRARGP
jgi:uncharacterized protein YcbX